MQRLMCAACAAFLALAGASPARADEAADMKAVVEKAIKAHGGLETLSKYKAVTAKSKGVFHGLGQPIDYTSTLVYQEPDKVRVETEGEFMGVNFKRVEVVNGNKGWIQLMGNTDEMSKDVMAEVQERLHAQAVAHLVALTNKDYKLSTLGEAKVGDRAAVGVRVEYKGRRDVNLFFDKENGLLLKSETRVKDVESGGDKEATQETYYSDYKKVEGMQVPFKVKVNRDGKLLVEAETTEFKPAEKLDDGQFGKP
jgi:outer membrane lipoprotein-sorting protein